MSILIKGIDLPKGARYADISFLDKFGMPVGDKYIEEAIQIPRPHGRLIDADELLSHLKKDPLFSLVEQYGISGVIESRPTILEAEE